MKIQCGKKKRKFIDLNKKLNNVVKRKVNLEIWVIFLISFLLLGLASASDYSEQFREWWKAFIKHFCEKNEWMNMYESIKTFRKQFIDLLEDLHEVLITFETILAAAVVFYYSVQDNRREGIPHRTILAYTYGSWSIPAVFLFTMLGVFVLYFSEIYELYWITSVLILEICFFQFLMIFLILLSTSYLYGVCAITNVEIRQYQFLLKNSQQLNSSCYNVNLYRHLEHVIKSDELLTDKMYLIQKLVRVPYFDKQLVFSYGNVIRSMVCKIKKRSTETYGVCLSYNCMVRLYEFYYENLLNTFEYLKSVEDKETLNRIFMILYDFLEELTRTYQNMRNFRSKKCKKNYHMTVSAIMNAAMAAGLNNSEAFCNYIFNKIIIEKEDRNLQLSLYFLFQEYLYKIDPAAIKLNHLENIEQLEKWRPLPKHKKMYESFWMIWTRQISFKKEDVYFYFLRWMNTLQNGDYESIPLSYVLYHIKQKKEKSNAG